MMHMGECVRRTRLLLLSGLPEGMTCQPEEITLLPGRGVEPLFLSPAPVVLCRPGLSNSRKIASEWAKRLMYTTGALSAKGLPTGQMEITLGDALLFGLWKDCVLPPLPDTLSLREEADPLFRLPFLYARLSSLAGSRADEPLSLPLEPGDRRLIWHLLRGETLLSASLPLASAWLDTAGPLTEAFLSERDALCHKTLSLLREMLAYGDKKHLSVAETV